jgi:hypothetical protein
MPSRVWLIPICFFSIIIRSLDDTRGLLEALMLAALKGPVTWSISMKLNNIEGNHIFFGNWKATSLHVVLHHR